MATKTKASTASTTQNTEPDDQNRTDTPTEVKGVNVPNSVNSDVKITVDESIKHLFTGEEPPEDEPNATGSNPVVTTDDLTGSEPDEGKHHEE